MPSYSYTVGTKSGKRIGTVTGYGKNRAAAQRNISRMLGRPIRRNNPLSGVQKTAVKKYRKMRTLERAGKVKPAMRVRMQIAAMNDRHGWTMADVARAFTTGFWPTGSLFGVQTGPVR